MTQIDIHRFSGNRFETWVQLPIRSRPAIQRKVIVVSDRSRRANFTFPLSPFRRFDNSFSVQPKARKPARTSRSALALPVSRPPPPVSWPAGTCPPSPPGRGCDRPPTVVLHLRVRQFQPGGCATKRKLGGYFVVTQIAFRKSGVRDLPVWQSFPTGNTPKPHGHFSDARIAFPGYTPRRASARTDVRRETQRTAPGTGALPAVQNGLGEFLTFGASANRGPWRRHSSPEWRNGQ